MRTPVEDLRTVMNIAKPVIWVFLSDLKTAEAISGESHQEEYPT